MSTRIEIKEECAPSINLLIQNCCDPLIQEIIPFGLPGIPPIGAFSDAEGNCWTLLGTTEDRITSIRKGNDQYGSCETCIADNPCPENLVVDSCCANFETIFSSTLPGVVVGDTFSDNFGFCWSITATTPAPINGVVSVGTAYPAENCTTCLDDNICPDIYGILSCCKSICDPNLRIQLFTTLAQLGGGAPGQTFVDTLGFCWQISPSPVATFTLLTGSFIQYDFPYVDCEACIFENNSCETLINYTIKNCETQEIAIVQALFGFSVGNSLLLNFTTDITPQCWEIISWDNTSLPTKIIKEIFDCFNNCITCINRGAGTAPYLITAPTLSSYFLCAVPSNYVVIESMVWGGSPTPVITYSWYQIDPLGGPDIEIGQYTSTLYLAYAYMETNLYCVITATNSAGATTVNTPQVYAYDCS
jgi:hypothetical protein